MTKFFKKILAKHITDSDNKAKTSETREVNTPATSEVKTAENCPYCESKEIIKRGFRYKKREKVQLYKCKDCERTFTPQIIKGKHYPLKVILDGLRFYYLGHSLNASCVKLKEKYGFKVKPATLSDWVNEFKRLCPFKRMRPFATKMFSPNQMIKTTTLFHRQVFQYKYHQGKLALLLQEEYKHHKFWPLREYMEAVSYECPHQLFKEGFRASELETSFSLKDVQIRHKKNMANRIAKLVIQSVKNNKKRHQCLQNFMLATDSVTVGCEVPIYINEGDVYHMEQELGFEIPLPTVEGIKNSKETKKQKRINKKIKKYISKGRFLLTGHIDLVQLRNGVVHIMDYKPNAAKKKPISQLTWYALALSRLTGLRMYEFKCAWFDKKDYFEFFPLHMVYKLKKRQKRVPKNQMALVH